MATIPHAVLPRSTAHCDGRRSHRLTCILVGGLALAGGVLALAVQPGFAALALVGGIWLILAPESKG